MAETKTPRTNKKPAAEKAKPVESEAVVESRPNWGFGSIFWGLLLITIGVLALLNNFGVVSLNLVGLSQLWPLLFVVWGISMLSVRTAVWRSLMIVLAIAVLGFIIWVAVGTSDLGGRQTAERQTASVAQSDSSVKKIDAYVEAGAGKINVDSAEMNDELRAVLDSNVSTLKKTTSLSGDTERIDLNLESRNHWWLAGVKNELSVTLGRKLPTSLSLKLGAADLSADLSQVKLDRLKLDLGAASANVRLGTNRDKLAVIVDAGASSLTLHIPQSSGVRVEVDGGVSSKDFEGLENKGDGVYESSNYTSANHQVTITGDIGATSFTIDRY